MRSHSGAKIAHINGFFYLFELQCVHRYIVHVSVQVATIYFLDFLGIPKYTFSFFLPLTVSATERMQPSSRSPFMSGRPLLPFVPVPPLNAMGKRYLSFWIIESPFLMMPGIAV